MSENTRIISTQLSDGTTFRVEAIAISTDTTFEDVADFDMVLPFNAITETIEKVAVSIQKSLEKIKPQKASIEFGVEVAVESGGLTALITKGSGKGNLKVTLEWESNAT